MTTAGDDLLILTPKAARNYVVDPETGCWLWQSYLTPLGYAYCHHRVEMRNVPVHRAFYELHVGPIPAGFHIDHLCLVRHCVNPEHLEAVTILENNRRRTNVKLDLAKAAEIRSSELSNRDLADRYGVTTGAIDLVRTGQNWAVAA